MHVGDQLPVEGALPLEGHLFFIQGEAVVQHRLHALGAGGDEDGLQADAFGDPRGDHVPHDHGVA